MTTLASKEHVITAGTAFEIPVMASVRFGMRFRLLASFRCTDHVTVVHGFTVVLTGASMTVLVMLSVATRHLPGYICSNRRMAVARHR
jgi:hypothetical protein